MTDCMGLGIEGDMDCDNIAVAVVRLHFDGITYPWAPMCPEHGMSVAANMSVASAVNDPRYGFDWMPIADMPDVEERHILDPAFVKAMEDGNPEDQRMTRSQREVVMQAQLSRLIGAPNQN